MCQRTFPVSQTEPNSSVKELCGPLLYYSCRACLAWEETTYPCAGCFSFVASYSLAFALAKPLSSHQPQQSPDSWYLQTLRDQLAASRASEEDCSQRRHQAPYSPMRSYLNYSCESFRLSDRWPLGILANPASCCSIFHSWNSLFLWGFPCWAEGYSTFRIASYQLQSSSHGC